ncbi:hypothetical protein Ahy_A07g037281 [Arachis hypogaea]|uniref:Uncharacterized protein n=1 Tax=Arachis hypogaea TaxID=3818 RepID=A0A445CIA6_ARAHY|nr:hypothetical protein Ahy_A07g037281 [Arachis hypogaea]
MSTRSNPPPEATAALMMIANTASYVPKQFSAPSFSLGFTNSNCHCYGYVISRMRVYAGGAPLKKDDRKIEPPYINILGKKKTQYKSFSLKIAEVDHFRVEYASWILFHEMNRDRDTTIRKSEAIRLSKPSAVLLSPYCQIELNDIDGD